jgi:adenine-specific DNA-methyltransferase
MEEMQKQELTSMNILEERIEDLKLIFPEVFSEGNQIDWEKLKVALGCETDALKERFGMNWPGKIDCFKNIQQPSIGTLVPFQSDSINFDSSKNIFIEGDNLEVLKLLQKSYLSKIRMIYIDPPYNTGKDFVYPDDYSENLDTYLAYTGQIDSEGKRFATNVDTDGRFHSKWLNMMYPRLFLAKNLLKEDGVIFVSINDKEQSNLKSLLNEIFGEENFIATLIWDKGHSAQAGIFKAYHEYIYVYAKNIELVGTPSSNNNDLFEAGAMKRESRRHPQQEFDFPAGVKFEAKEGTEFSGSWGGAEKVEVVKGRMVCENGKTKFPVTLKASFTQRNQMYQFFYGDKESLVDSRGQKVVDFYFNSSGKIKIVKERGVYTPDTTLSDYGTQSNASNDLASLFSLDESPMDNPKPPKLLSDFISWFCDEEDIVLDFFAGSGSTGQAVYENNIENNKGVSFILVQLPEKTEVNWVANRAGFKTISELCRNRLINFITKTKTKSNLFAKNLDNIDLGFKFYKLSHSNFKVWDATLEKDPETIQQKLFEHINHISPAAEQEAILYELLLKSGFELTTPIEVLTLAGKTVFSIADGQLLICLEKEITHDCIKAMAEKEPSRVICLDEAFTGTNADALKTNAVQIMKSKGVVNFRTV